MKKRKIIRGADLFCGAGGTTTGLRAACEVLGYELDLFAVNHWQIAVDTHRTNHRDLYQNPKRVIPSSACMEIDSVDPRIAVPGGRLDILCASPECTFFSVARGGKPVTDQGRASAWLILRWAELLYIETILIENVKEFRDWCPVGSNGRPMKSRKGETFKAFIGALQSLGYKVEWRVMNAADFGAATTRERLFIQARRGRKPITWPAPSHSKTGAATLFGRTKKWRAAREIISWDTPSKSIFGRKRPLAATTMARIIAGLEKFGRKELEPFLVILRNNQTAQSIDGPVPAITTSGAHHALVQPFLSAFHGGKDGSSRNYPLSKPLGTLDTSNRFGLVEPVPFILGHRQFDEACVDSIERPLRTITARGGSDMGIVEPKPFVIGAGGPTSGQRPQSLDAPLGTVLTENHRGLVQPFIVPVNHGKNDTRSNDIDKPLPTVTSVDATGLVQPFVMKVTHSKSGNSTVRSSEQPISTITTAKGGEHALVEPFLQKYYKSGDGVTPVSDPVPTVTTKDRFALVTPLIIETADGQQLGLDIHFRMLKPRELARAMSFPDTYEFTGSREVVVKQIGNAVDCRMAQALCGAVLS